MGQEGQIICVDFSETAPLQRYTTSSIVWLFVRSAILETTHAHFNSACVFTDSRTCGTEDSALQSAFISFSSGKSSLPTLDLMWGGRVLPLLLVVECSAFLASGSDPTVPKLIAMLEFCM